MKLSPALKRSLIGNDRTRGDVVDNACELLTGQILVWLRAKRRAILDRQASLPPGDPEAALLSAQVKVLGEVLVELAEKP